MNSHVHGDLRLFPHLGQDHILGIRFDSAGVDEAEGPSPPLGFCVDPVPGDPRSIFHNGDSPAYDLIKKSGFSHIRPAYDRYHWFTH